MNHIPCRWLVDFLLKRGHLHDLAPHQAGYKIFNNVPQLKRFMIVLMQGTESASGQPMMFRSLRHAASVHPGLRQLRKDMNVNTWATVWNQLRAAFPDLGMWQQLVKKVREAPKAQSTGRQWAGLIDVVFQEKHMGHPLANQVHEPGYNFRLKPIVLDWNVWVDAGTVEPIKYITKLQGIGMKGQERPVVQSGLMNKGVSFLSSKHTCKTHAPDAALSWLHPLHGIMQEVNAPEVMFYTFGSAHLGSDVTCVLMRSRAYEEQPHAWITRLKSNQKQRIIEVQYGNYPESLEHISHQEVEALHSGVFDPIRHCMV